MRRIQFGSPRYDGIWPLVHIYRTCTVRVPYRYTVYSTCSVRETAGLCMMLHRQKIEETPCRRRSNLVFSFWEIWGNPRFIFLVFLVLLVPFLSIPILLSFQYLHIDSLKLRFCFYFYLKLKKFQDNLKQTKSV